MTDPAGVDGDVVALVRELVARASENPPGDERAVAEYVESRLEASPVPFDVESYEAAPDRPNVVATVGDPAHGSVLLTGHLDVVPATAADWSGDPYELRERDGRVVGRGVADMKGALAAKVLAAEQYYRATDDPGEVCLAFVVDEEVGGAGTRALVERGVDVDAAVVGEPSDLQIGVAQKGVVRYEVTVRGESGHSGRPDDAVNAIEGMRRVLERIEALDSRRRAETSHPFLAPETVTVTEIHGGIAPNVVPDTVRATVDWRLLPGATDPDPFDRELRAAVGDATLDGAPVDVTVERTVFARPAEVPADHDLVRTVRAAAEAVGVAAEPVGFDAVTDAHFLVHDAGVPTVVFGPGSLERDAHTVDESVAVADLELTVDVYRETLGGLLG
jgi:acetylornithine deacetylase/succinyl-diaminopimelate desuccinylase family protein